MPTVEDLLREGHNAFRRPHWAAQEFIHVAQFRVEDGQTQVQYCDHTQSRDRRADADPEQWDDWQSYPWENEALDLYAVPAAAIEEMLPLLLESVLRSQALEGVVDQLRAAAQAGQVEACLTRFQEELGMPPALIESLRQRTQAWQAEAALAEGTETIRVPRWMVGPTMRG